jgi:antitoxin component YwqK of YwqJK toxin-antitoxin module
MMGLFSITTRWVLLLLSGVTALHGQNLLDEQGRKTGPWKVEYPNSKILYEANFHEGRPVGEMIRYYRSGAVRARMMFDSLEDRSFTKLYYENGKQAAEGWYENKVKDSVWNYFSEFDGTVRIRETYENGNLHGMVRSYYPSGQVSEEVTWIQNKKDGPWRQFYADGTIRLESCYKNDKLHGSYEMFYTDNTMKIRGEYRDNLTNGTWSFYDEKGSEIFTIEYLHGQAVDQEKYLQMMQDTLKKYEMISEPEFIQHEQE